MTTLKDIDDQINNDIKRFHQGAYQGFVPPEFIEYFKAACMHIPPSAHRIGMDRVRTMSARNPDDVPFIEVGVMINMIFGTTFQMIYSSLEEGIEMTEKFEKVRDEYNKIADEFDQKIARKRASLMKIAGLTNSIPFNSRKLIMGEA